MIHRLIAFVAVLSMTVLLGATSASAMNKAELVEGVASKTGMTRPEAQRAVDAVLDSILQRARNGTVEINGFGTFTVTNRSTRVGRNPQTGKSIQIPAKPSSGADDGRDSDRDSDSGDHRHGHSDGH